MDRNSVGARGDHGPIKALPSLDAFNALSLAPLATALQRKPPGTPQDRPVSGTTLAKNRESQEHA